MNKKIEHPGVIQAISADKVIVRIEQVSACSGCHAKNACTMADKVNKEIEITVPENSFKINEAVLIEGKNSMGMLAVWYAFGLPLVLLFSTLFLTSIYLSETYAILSVLAVLIVYYFILYLFRHKLKNKFEFQLKKQVV